MGSILDGGLLPDPPNTDTASDVTLETVLQVIEKFEQEQEERRILRDFARTYDALPVETRARVSLWMAREILADRLPLTTLP